MPWDFLDGVMQKGGVVAVIFLLVLIASGFLFRMLWNQNQCLHKQLAELQEKRLEDALKMHERMADHTVAIDHAMGRLTSSLDTLIQLSGRD